MVTNQDEGSPDEVVAITLIAHTQRDKEKLYALFNHTNNISLLGDSLCFHVRIELDSGRYYNKLIKTENGEPFYR